MAQLHYGDMEARRQLADLDHGEDVNIQGEGYGIFSDDQKRSPNSPPPRSMEAPLQVHHQRHDAISGTDLSSPLTDVPSRHGTVPITSGYGNLDLKPEEAGKALPAASADKGRFDRSGVPEEESMAKELQDQSASGGGIIDVHSLKDDFVDLSEGNANQQSSADVPTGESAEREGMIDVHSLKDNFVDFSDGSTNQQSSANDPTDEAAKAREATAQLTSEIKSPVDDPKQQQSSQIDAPIVDPEQEQTAQQPVHDEKQKGSQPCNESHGCQSFEGDDGREKINVESFNIYSGEPQNVVYDAADVMNGQPERELNEKDDGTKNTYEISDDIKEEEKPLPNEGEHDSREVAPGILVEDASYVMGGPPESGVVVEADASGQDMQDAVSGKPPLKEETNMRNLPEGEPDNAVNDTASVMGGQPESVVGVDDVGMRDSQAVLAEAVSGKQPLKEEIDMRDLPEGKPENAVYDAAAVMGGQPGSMVDVYDVGVRDSQAALGEEQEQKPLLNEENVDARSLQTEEGADTCVEQTPFQQELREGLPEDSVDDGLYVMANQPGSGIAAKDDASGQHAQDVFGKSPSKEEADMRDLQEGKLEDSVYAVGDGEPEQTPLSHEENVNVLNFQIEGSQEGAPESSVDDGLYVMASQPQSGVVKDDASGQDTKDVFGKLLSKEETDMPDLRKSKPEPESVVDALGDGEQEQKTLPNEENVIVRDFQVEGEVDSSVEQKPFPNESADVRDMQAVLGDGEQEQKPLPEEENVDVRDFQVEGEVDSSVDSSVEQKPFPNESADVCNMQAVLGDGEQEQKPLPEEENVDVRDMHVGGVEQEQKPLPNEENVDVRELLTEEGADTAIEQKPLPNEENVDVREMQTEEAADTAIEQKPLPNEENVDVHELQAEEGADIPVEHEDKATIADVKSDFQTGMRQVRNPDQPLFDDDVDVQGVLLSKDMPDVPKEAISGEKVKEAEQEQDKRDSAALGEEQKEMAQTGEQFILNSPVVDYNSMNVPAEHVAELKVDGPDGDSSLKDAEGASAASPYTEFDRAHDYVKVGYGGEGFVPKKNEEVDMELKEPVDQETERRRTDEHPLDKSLQIDTYGVTDGKLPSGDVYGVHEGKADASRPPADEGKLEEATEMKPSEFGANVPVQASVVNERPPTMPHPQPEDLAGIVNNNSNSKEVHSDEGQHPEGAPHKKGVFERIKEKFTPHNEHK